MGEYSLTVQADFAAQISLKEAKLPGAAADEGPGAGKTGLSHAAIAGIVIGGVGGIALLAIAACVLQSHIFLPLLLVLHAHGPEACAFSSRCMLSCKPWLSVIFKTPQCMTTCTLIWRIFVAVDSASVCATVSAIHVVAMYMTRGICHCL